MSISGTGVDITSNHRMLNMIDRYGDRFLNRVFTSFEAQFCQKRKDYAAAFAARFAAKEAFFKAIGTGLRNGMSWTDVEIRNDQLGKPFFKLYGRIAGIVADKKIHLSLSHTDDNSIAFVIIEESEA